MTDSQRNNLLNDPGNGVCGLFEYVFRIVAAHWRTFGVISLFQAGSVAILYVLFFLIVALINIESVLERSLTSTDYDDSVPGGVRFLLNYATGAGVPARLLNEEEDPGVYYDDNNYYYTDDDYYNTTDDDYAAVSALSYYIYDFLPKPLDRIYGASVSMGINSMAKRGSIMAMVFAFIILRSFVVSIFKGALIRATAEAYAGTPPAVFSCLQAGMRHLCAIFCCHVLLLTSLATVGLLFVVGPTLGTKSPWALAATVLTYLLFVVLVCAAMVAAVPSIVVEQNTSPCTAFQRSRRLCRSHIAFIFRTMFFFQFLETGISLIIFLILYFTPDSIHYVIQFMLQVATIPLATILEVVVYMTLRVRCEGYSQDSLLQDLSLSPAFLEVSHELNLCEEKINTGECA